MTDDAQAQQRKRKQTRSPNYPAIDLGKAVSRIETLYANEHRHAAHYDAVVNHWGLGPKSSTAMQTVAALKAFGFIEVEGKGSNRQIKLSPRGLDVVEHEEGADERNKALQDAALAPNVHRDIWDHYGGPKYGSDASLKLFLIREKGFNPKSAEPFIEQYKATISFANLAGGRVIDEEFTEEKTLQIAAGDYVQWTSQGVAQFSSPKRVINVSDDSTHAFVEGSPTGIPVEQLEKADPPGDRNHTNGNNGPQKPPIQPRTEGQPGMKHEVADTETGPVTVQWPSRLSQADYDDISAWLDILKRKMGRYVRKPPEGEQNTR